MSPGPEKPPWPTRDVIREIIREELRSRTERLTWDGATIREIVREEMVCAYVQEGHIQPRPWLLRKPEPSPDWEAQATRWRKIADELAESLRGICKLADPYGGWAGALKAYDEAVKESQ